MEPALSYLVASTLDRANETAEESRYVFGHNNLIAK